MYGNHHSLLVSHFQQYGELVCHFLIFS
jgi:hypothetical protein